MLRWLHSFFARKSFLQWSEGCIVAASEWALPKLNISYLAVLHGSFLLNMIVLISLLHLRPQTVDVHLAVNSPSYSYRLFDFICAQARSDYLAKGLDCQAM